MSSFFSFGIENKKAPAEAGVFIIKRKGSEASSGHVERMGVSGRNMLADILKEGGNRMLNEKKKTKGYLGVLRENPGEPCSGVAPPLRALYMRYILKKSLTVFLYWNISINFSNSFYRFFKVLWAIASERSNCPFFYILYLSPNAVRKSAIVLSGLKVGETLDALTLIAFLAGSFTTFTSIFRSFKILPRDIKSSALRPPS